MSHNNIYEPGCHFVECNYRHKKINTEIYFVHIKSEESHTHRSKEFDGGPDKKGVRSGSKIMMILKMQKLH